MPFSRLQRFILTELIVSRQDRYPRGRLIAFYQRQTQKPKDVENILTKSLERLIDKELLVGYGRRTPHMWFIDEVRLTAKGRTAAKRLLGEQLPLFTAKRKSRL